MVRINWLATAKEDLKEIYHYIATDSKRYARLQVEKIQKRTEMLKSQTRIGRIVEEMENENIRELIEGNYRVIYRIVNEKRIDILMVHHGARDLRRRVNP